MRVQFGSNVKFVMMNSFSTSDDTKAHLSTTHPALVAAEGWELVQNKSPKVDISTMEPVSYPENPAMEWCAVSLIWQLLYNFTSGNCCQCMAEPELAQPSVVNVQVRHDGL